MTQDKYAHLAAGDSLPDTAAFWNDVIGLARGDASGEYNAKQRIKQNPALLKVQLADGGSVDQWTPCVLGEPVIDGTPFSDNGYVPLFKVRPASSITGIQRRHLGRIVVPAEPMSGTDVVWAAAAGIVPGTVQMPSGRPLTRRLTANPNAGGAGWLGLNPDSTGYQIPSGGELMWWDAAVLAGGGVTPALIRIPGYTPGIWFSEGPQPLMQEVSIPSGGGSTLVGPKGLAPIGADALYVDWASGGGVQIKGPFAGVVRAWGYVKYKPANFTSTTGSAIATGSGVTTTKYYWASSTAGVTVGISSSYLVGVGYPSRHYISDGASTRPDPGFQTVPFWTEGYFDGTGGSPSGFTLAVYATADTGAKECVVAATMSVSIMEEALHNQNGRSIPL